MTKEGRCSFCAVSVSCQEGVRGRGRLLLETSTKTQEGCYGKDGTAVLGEGVGVSSLGWGSEYFFSEPAMHCSMLIPPGWLHTPASESTKLGFLCRKRVGLLLTRVSALLGCVCEAVGQLR